MNWTETKTQLPERGVVVETKIDDASGIRNETQLKLGDTGRLWFVPDGEMYVYYTPTHWKPIKDALERGKELLMIPMSQLPPLCVEYSRHLCGQLGGCIEVILTAYSAYAECVEGLPRSADEAYIASPSARVWFAERK